MKNPSYGFRVLWSDEDQAYVATCPEFDGVSGVGSSAEAALAEARVALDLAIETCEEEGWPLPKASVLTEHSGQFRLRLPSSLHGRLALRAAEEGVSLNALALSFISEGIGASDAHQEVRRCFVEMRADFQLELRRSFFTNASRETAFAPAQPSSPPSLTTANVLFGESACLS